MSKLINKPLCEVDPTLYNIIKNEEQRQEDEINLIASENATYRSVMEAVGCVMTNKYAEGYPSKRYYGGCKYVDEAEVLAISRAKEIFKAEHANVQPHSGSQANNAVFRSFLNHGDKILGMDLAAGGHLTHGFKLNFSGKDYTVFSYGLERETELIDYDQVEEIAEREKPGLIIAGGSAYSRVIDFEIFGRIAKNVGARLLADISHIAGLVATGLHPSPIHHAEYVTFTTHKTMRGPRGGVILCKKEYAREIDREMMPGIQGGPQMHTIAAKAVGFGIVLQPEFKEYISQVILNANVMCDEFTKQGFRVISEGTDTHLFLLDVCHSGIESGKKAEEVLKKVGIVVNKNGIPFDDKKAWITSGIRIGTPTVTSRGMGEEDMREITKLICIALRNRENENTLEKVREQVKELTKRYPVYK